jgi:heme exporter protein B
LIVLMTVIYNVPLLRGWLALVLVLGTLGFSTVGTLLATMTVQTRARESLLPIVMMPVALPLLLAAVRATTAILNDAPQESWLAWAQILAVLNVIFMTICFLLFEFVIEE